MRKRRAAENMIAVLESDEVNALAGTLLDAVPFPAFLVDEMGRVAGYNAAAEQAALAPANDVQRELWECLWTSHVSQACGRDNICGGCFVWNMVQAAFSGCNTVREKVVIQLIRTAGVRSMEVRASATLVEHERRRSVLLVIELPEIHPSRAQLVPICAQCKKVHDESGSWKSVEHFLNGTFGVRLTHGLCPECLADSMAQLGRETE